MKRIYRRNIEEMYSLMESYELGHMSRTAFCSHHDLPLSVFGYWRSKYRKSQELKNGSKQQDNFVALEVSPPASGSVVLELELGKGVKLIFHQYPEVKYLHALLSVDLC